ncbi:right-handed parallel beta-helix repeat-containing protein [Streptomyces sp. NPDC006193]|uniref:right-handed parallel beta-helix repeat-containing protein n=1 Tax=Streptomyces sp. NPDC006193 TaxID=3155717 RepID=UPI0033A800BF
MTHPKRLDDAARPHPTQPTPPHPTRPDRPDRSTRPTRPGAGARARGVRPALRAAAALPVAAALLLAPAAAVSAAGPDDPAGQRFTAEESETQAALVAAEDHRLDQVRAVAAVAPLKDPRYTRPYRTETTGGYTLVLTRRSRPYSVADLLQLAPQTFVRKADGSYLLTENIYLNSGAKLRLSNPGGLNLHMASNRQGFVSIVSFGGRIVIDGAEQAHVKVSSWDPRKNKPDTDVRDGRAYIRAIGGQFSMSYADISDLGFWSGRTGGLSLTGTDRPNTGSLSGPDAPTGEDGRLSSSGVLTGPSGRLTTPDSRFGTPQLSYVSADISHSTVSGNVYGLFASGATGVTVESTTIERSRQDGLVLHRFVTNAVVERTTSRENGGDGFVMARATQQVRVTGSKALDNGGNGYTISGQPLAHGPSASGQSVGSYGSNSVSSSLAEDNGHYGIEVVGGTDVGVQDNTVIGGDMGIVARKEAEKVAVTGNRLVGQSRQGVSVRDGVTGAKVTGNIVEKADTAVYVRDSVAEVRGNTVEEAGNHGVSLVGGIDGSTVSYNVIAGVGPSAVDTSRAHGSVSVRENQTFAWYDTSSFWVKLRHYASPMTLLWTGILLLILFSAVRGRRGRGRHAGPGVHPYLDKAPLPRHTVREVPPTGRPRVPVMSE